MKATRQHKYTIDDIYSLPEGTHAELIDGHIYYMSPPNTKHQRISGEIFAEIKNYLRSHNATCEVFSAPFAVFLDDTENKYVEPDISIICDKNKINTRGCQGAPDLVIEIVSPSSKTMDYYIKTSAYKLAGVREYWIVDPMRETIIVYIMENDAAPILYHFNDNIKIEIFDELYICLTDLKI